MKYELYAIKDAITGLFGEPFTALNVGAATRRFAYVCEKGEMVANDLLLYRIGIYDTDLGEITPKLEFIQNGTRAEVNNG